MCSRQSGRFSHPRGRSRMLSRSEGAAVSLRSFGWHIRLTLGSYHCRARTELAASNFRPSTNSGTSVFGPVASSGVSATTLTRKNLTWFPQEYARTGSEPCSSSLALSQVAHPTKAPVGPPRLSLIFRNQVFAFGFMPTMTSLAGDSKVVKLKLSVAWPCSPSGNG